MPSRAKIFAGSEPGAFMTQLYFVAPAHFAARPSRALRLT